LGLALDLRAEGEIELVTSSVQGCSPIGSTCMNPGLNACLAVHESPPVPVICRSIGHVTGTLTAPEVDDRSGVGDGPATHVGYDASSDWRIVVAGSHVCPIRATPARRWW
jgi:hypothetical protein